MPTNEERREVAENLRDMTVCGCRYAEQFYELLKETVMSSSYLHSFGDVANRLADLIEPEPERTCKMELVKSGPIYSVWRFSCCGYEHSENMTDGGATELPGTRCPKCGTKVEE